MAMMFIVTLALLIPIAALIYLVLVAYVIAKRDIALDLPGALE
jgi:hypothetical protein